MTEESSTRELSKHDRQVIREYAFNRLNYGELPFRIARAIMVKYNASWTVSINLVKQAERVYNKYGNRQSTCAEN